LIKIRLQRRGRKKRPFYHIVVADSRAPRDGRVVERLGRFDNVSENQQLVLDEDRVIYWLGVGAKPSETVRSLLKKEGILYKMHLLRWGWEDEKIEAALKEWRDAKEAKGLEKVQSRKDQQKELLSAEEKAYQSHLEEKAAAAAKKMAEEKKAKEEAEAAEVEVASEEVAEAPTEEPVAEEVAAEEAPAEEVAEAPAEEPVAEEVAAEEAPAEEATEAPVEEAAEAPAEEPVAEEVAAEEAPAEEATEAPVAEEVAAEEAPAEEDAEAPAEEVAEAPAQLSTDMTAGDAINHIKETDLKDLEGFVPESEDRVTVVRAWEAKQG
jgi:small subunit ribosomal protein S16